METNIITVVICTHNRDELLAICLASLQRQCNQGFDILVVDNYGSEECRQLATSHGASYIHEPVTGLSHARNRGWQETKTEWVLYLDDDAKAATNLTEQLLKTIKYSDFDAIGGRFTHWFRTPPPEWLILYYGKDGHRPSEATNTTELPADKYLTGGILAIRRSLLQKLNGFSTDLGMSGQEIGWGEEDELQDRIRAAGSTVGYNPEMVIDHLVQPYKYLLRNRIHMAYAHGRDEPPSVRQLKIRHAYKDIAQIVFITLPYDVARVLFRPNFHWQNGVVSTFGKLAAVTGRLRSHKSSLPVYDAPTNKKDAKSP